VQFNRDCYSLVYRLILDALHHYNILYVHQQQSHGQFGVASEKSDPKEKSSKEKDKEEKIDLDHVKSILGIFKKLLDDATHICQFRRVHHTTSRARKLTDGVPRCVLFCSLLFQFVASGRIAASRTSCSNS
jgi:hypothetical protein